jgi:large subunit ribosomal protein L3
MIQGLLGKKLGMTQIFTEEGGKVPVTVIEAGPCTVQSVKTTERDGYEAVQLGFANTGENNIKKPQREVLKSKKLPPKKYVKEVPCDSVSEIEIGAVVTNLMFQVGDYVDITGTSKGKGFQGGVKRHGWSGGKETHGSKSHRAPGSIGQSSSPSRVFKGMGMPGQMGNERKTVQNVRVIDVNNDNNTIAVKGAVPGANKSYLIIKYALKKELAPRVQPEDNESAEQENGEKKEGKE